MKELSFDWALYNLALKLPYFGKPIAKYYMTHDWFRRFAKFAVSTFIMYWLLKGPLIWLLTQIMPSINLLLFQVPSYVLGGFFAGIIVTVIGFVVNEVWVWSKQ